MPDRAADALCSALSMRERDIARYLGEIVHQGHFAMIAAESLNTAIRRDAVPARSSPSDSARYLAAAQALLTAAAQISKIVDVDAPRRGSAAVKRFGKERAAILCAIIDPSPLLLSRDVRNSVEHFDERLDEALCEEPTISLVDANVSIEGGIVFEGATSLRHLNLTTLEYSALDDAVRLQDLFDAVMRASERATAWIAAHHASRN